MGEDEREIARFREFGRRTRASRRLRPNDWTPEEVERRIRDEDVEWAYVFDPIGRQVLRKLGTTEGVFFTAEETPLLRDALLIHNHPLTREEAEATRVHRTVQRVADWARFAYRREEAE